MVWGAVLRAALQPVRVDLSRRLVVRSGLVPVEFLVRLAWVRASAVRRFQVGRPAPVDCLQRSVVHPSEAMAPLVATAHKAARRPWAAALLRAALLRLGALRRRGALLRAEELTLPAVQPPAAPTVRAGRWSTLTLDARSL